MSVHMFLITLILVNLLVLNVNVFVNSVNVLYICKKIFRNKLDLKLTSSLFVHMGAISNT